MQFSPRSISTIIILIVCAISGIVSGVTNPIPDLHGYAFDTILDIVRAYATNSGEGLNLLLTPIIPGMVFGFLFSITLLGVDGQRRYRDVFQALAYIVCYTLASGIIYFFAWFIAFITAFTGSLVLAGGFAGLVGASVLAIITKLLTRLWMTPVRLNIGSETRTAIGGTIAGTAFGWWLLLFSENVPTVAWCFAFAIWQSVVGFLLNMSIRSPDGQKSL